jgi:sugar phosphate isomerase/epimerase
MRLGGPVWGKFETCARWAEAVRELGYSAAYSPVKADADESVVKAYAQAAKSAGLVIAETGAWSNPLSPDEKTRREAVELNRRSLDLAERIGARCCVNISGSRGEQWDGPHPDNLTDETFDLVVETVRGIIDAVKPKRTFYTLETMPWMVPDSAESYVRLMKAIARKAFAVHFDPANLISSPQKFYASGALIRDFVRRLGRHIRSCHAKDVALSGKMTTHLDEVRPGLGGLDWRTYLTEIDSVGDGDTPVMLEHLKTEEEYAHAAKHVRSVAAEAGVKLL